MSSAEADVDASAGGGVDDVEADVDCGSDDVCTCMSDSVTLEAWKKNIYVLTKLAIMNNIYSTIAIVPKEMGATGGKHRHSCTCSQWIIISQLLQFL